MVGANGKVTKRATKAKKGTKKDLAKLETSRQQANIGISKKLQPKNKPPFFKLDQKVKKTNGPASSVGPAFGRLGAATIAGGNKPVLKLNFLINGKKLTKTITIKVKKALYIKALITQPIPTIGSTLKVKKKIGTSLLSFLPFKKLKILTAKAPGFGSATGVAKIGTGALGAPTIGTGGLGAATIGTGTLGAATIGKGTLGAATIGTGALGSATLGTGALGSAKLGVGALGAGGLAVGTLGGTLAAGTLGGGVLGLGALAGGTTVVGTGAVAGTGALGTGALEIGAIGAGALGAGALAAGGLGGGAPGAGERASGAVETAALARTAATLNLSFNDFDGTLNILNTTLDRKLERDLSNNSKFFEVFDMALFVKFVLFKQIPTIAGR